MSAIPTSFDYAVVGGGIVGLATAEALLQRCPQARVVLLEKEAAVALHQTGRNSGVLHSGIYYKPGSLKAKLCIEGNRRLLHFCREENIPHDVCGKLIVATSRQESERLDDLYTRAMDHGIGVRKVNESEVKDIEPHVSCLVGLFIPSTGIVDYVKVCERLAERFRSRSGEIRFGAEVFAIHQSGSLKILRTKTGPVHARFIVNCAGLHSDRIAKMDGADPGARIVPFRGEYFELKAEKRSLVRNLVYPVPDPRFPFLGVHFTRMISGEVHAGPNAVLSLKREGYHRTAFNLRDFLAIVTYSGFWRLAAKHLRTGLQEVHRSFSKRQFTRSLQRLIPAIREDDLVPSAPGVRAQALLPDGGLVDDFLIVRETNAIHVCNAPSPAATACLEIGRVIADQVPV